MTSSIMHCVTVCHDFLIAQIVKLRHPQEAAVHSGKDILIIHSVYLEKASACKD